MEFLPGFGGSVRSRTFSVLNVFFSYAVARGALPASPLAQVRRPRYRGAVRFGHEEPDLNRYHEAHNQQLSSNRPSDRFAASRLRTMVFLSLAYGLSTQEILTLPLTGWHPASGSLSVVRGKNDRARSLAVQGAARQALDHYFSLRPSFSVPELFITWTGHPCDHWTVAAQLKKFKARHRLPGTSGLHELRHTVGRKLLEQGRSLDEIAAFFGHYNLGSTEAYLRHHWGRSTQAGAEVLSLLLQDQGEKKGDGPISAPALAETPRQAAQSGDSPAAAGSLSPGPVPHRGTGPGLSKKAKKP